MERKKLAREPSAGGVTKCEIDESKIIGNYNNVYWMFGIVDRSSKEARAFTVLNNRTKEEEIIISANIIFLYNLITS